jgi:dsRNA-specific ribonuclease
VEEGEEAIPIDMDELCVYSLKMFGDVFESIIGAVFIDSMSIVTTRQVLLSLLKPYIHVYASDVKHMQDHSRTLLLELWNSKPFAKSIKCNHEVNNKNETMEFKGILK